MILPRRKVCSSSLSATTRDPQEEEEASAAEVVNVYDSVVSSVTCQVLHALSLDQSLRLDGETCGYVRPPFNSTYLTPLEHAMESILVQMDVPTPLQQPTMVEYWSRTEYMNMDAHVDVDEQSLLQEGTIRYPHCGHILYLQVSPDLQAPTCVFYNQRVGWAGGAVDLVTIPAKEGRLVRFPGDAMHAVPYPAHRWFMNQEELEILKEHESCEEDEDDNDYEDGMGHEDDAEVCNDEDDNVEYDDDDETTERSVLLFNTWPITDETPPPQNICSDPILNHHKEDHQNHLSQLVEEWDADFGKDAVWIRCHPRSDWSPAPTRRQQPESPPAPPFASTTDTAPPTKIRIPLMGESNRRLYPEQMANLHLQGVSAKGLQTALTEEQTVTFFQPLGDTMSPSR